MREELQPGYVLHARPYRDTSLILDCFCRDIGRVSLLARGARAAKPKQKPQTHPFTPLLLSWTGRSELKTLISAEPVAHTRQPQGHSLFAGFYINELLVRLLPAGDPHPELWQCYSKLLPALFELDTSSGSRMLEPLLREFELILLAELGYAVDFSWDLTGEPIRENCVYQLVDLQGFVVVAEGSGHQGRVLLAIAQGDFQQPDVRLSAKQLCRQLLRPHLGDKPLQSRELFRQVL